MPRPDLALGARDTHRTATGGAGPVSRFPGWRRSRSTAWRSHPRPGVRWEGQASALLAAHRHGYYTSPRHITTEQIAGEVGRSRTTFEEHLRKAENRIVAAIVPYLQLYSGAEHPPQRMPLKATLVESGTPLGEGW